MMMKVFSTLMDRAGELNLLWGISMGKGDTRVRVSHLFFADDTLVLCEPDVNALLYLRCILLYFQMVLGLKINLRKTEIVRIAYTGDERRLTRMLGCKVTPLSVKDLEIPLGAKYKNVNTWKPVDDLFERRLVG